jgi:8-oxo-dGTP diphosphatase
MKERFKLIPLVSVIIKKDNKLLLARRFNTGYGDGLYALPGGGVDGNETILQAVIREAQEELAITLRQKDLQVLHVSHIRYPSKTETIRFFIVVDKWDGEIINNEPGKCDDIRWFELNKLPENLLDPIEHVLEKISQGRFYSEFGWEK